MTFGAPIPLGGSLSWPIDLFKDDIMSTNDDDAPDGMLAYEHAIRSPNRNDPNWPLPSFDARDWAKAFCEIAAKTGHPGIDEGWMISWFANALMRGYDERAIRMGKSLS